MLRGSSIVFTKFGALFFFNAFVVSIQGDCRSRGIFCNIEERPAGIKLQDMSLVGISRSIFDGPT